VNAGKFLSSYVRTADVKRPQTVTVDAVESEEIGTGDDRSAKLVAYFTELEQGVVLGSKAVLGFFVENFGEETDEWVGKEVVLYKDPSVTYKGKRVVQDWCDPFRG
jgi:hypothetical protein